MAKRTRFPRVFWIANSIEILERFAYYGIYLGFGIYAVKKLGFSKEELGSIQSLFLAVSYLIPVFSGTLADKFGFKKLLIISYLAYLPAILFLLISHTFTEVKLTMLTIALAAGTFKPLISGTVRAVTDATNKTLGFGIFYQMVNIGATFGPMVAAKLRVISWNYAFMLAAFCISIMLVLTILFYKEPERQKTDASVGKKMLEIVEVILNWRFSFFLILLGVFFWLPFWSFFNLGSIYVDEYLNTGLLYEKLRTVIGPLANFLSHHENNVWVVNGESIANSAIYIILFQLVVSRFFEKRAAIPSFVLGMFIAAIGFLLLGYALIGNPAWVFPGVALFAVGEMISSPRIQEYITWLAPKEKAGMYMGTNFLATFIGGLLSGYTYTRLLGVLENVNHPWHTGICKFLNLPAESNITNAIWFILALHLVVGIFVILGYVRLVGSFHEQTE
jgi:proton-dependent oligopeptide transporter, POT family